MGTVVLTKKEYKEIEQAIRSKRYFRCFFGAANVVVAGAIFALSKVGFEVDSTLIYMLLRVFVICGLFGIWFLWLGLWSTIVLIRFRQGMCDVVVCTKPHFCMNVVRRDLRGKRYIMLKCLSVKYALRLKNL